MMYNAKLTGRGPNGLKMNSSDIKRLRIRNAVEVLKREGISISKIAKELGISYKHAKQIYEQDSELKNDNET